MDGDQTQTFGSAQGPDTLMFQSLFEASPFAQLVLAPDAPMFTIVAASEQYLQATRRTRADLLGKGLFEAFPGNPDDPAATGVRNLEASLQRVLSERAVQRMALQKYDIPAPDGEFEERYWRPLNAPVLGPDGAVQYIVHTVEDVTPEVREQHEVASTLQATKAELAATALRLKAVLDNATVGLFLMDERHECAFMNAAAEQITGYTLEETRGRHLHDVLHHTRPDGTPYPASECPIDQVADDQTGVRGEEVFVHKDGRFYPVSFTANPIRDSASQTIGTIIEVQDISERRRSEEARELLIREVDHRARNTLTVVQSILQLTRSPDVEAYKATVLGRVSALARAQGALAARRWEGARLDGVVCDELNTLARPSQYRLRGPDLMLAPDQVQPVSMIVHELATNAAKYGALSRDDGWVEVSWADERTHLRLGWAETGGPPASPPSRQGFGSRLIENLVSQLQGDVSVDWAPQGLRFEVVFPKAR